MSFIKFTSGHWSLGDCLHTRLTSYFKMEKGIGFPETKVFRFHLSHRTTTLLRGVNVFKEVGEHTYYTYILPLRQIIQRVKP